MIYFMPKKVYLIKLFAFNNDFLIGNQNVSKYIYIYKILCSD